MGSVQHANAVLIWQEVKYSSNILFMNLMMVT